MTARLAFLYLPRCKPRPLVSLGLFVFFTALTAWLRLDVFGEQTITLTYGLPLLVCLWYPDLRLLWGMTATFTALSAWKTFVQLPPLDGDSSELMWTMQLINTGFIAVAVHLIVNFVAQLAAQKARLEETNLELMAREEEISRQNEELQTQTEELAQQNEEIQQQSEEVQQQSEELQAQTDELQALNLALGKRQHLLEALLAALPGERSDPELPERVCQSLLTLFGDAVGSAILEKTGDQLVILAHGGLGPLERDRWPFERSFAAVVMEHDRTAFVADLRARPDLILPRPKGRELLSVLAAPLRLNGLPIGSLEVYSAAPRSWTAEEFRLIEWVAAQCSLIVEVRRLHSELRRANVDLDRMVRERTAELQEMVNELEHFSYTITHDLRAPLRAMHGFSEMLAEEFEPVLDGQGRLYLERIATAANRMDRLITDALSFSRVMRQEMSMTPQDPAALIAGMIESYPIFQAPNARIEIVDTIPPVLANEAGLTQCFSNLLGNAVKFVPKGRVPEVRIRAETRGACVRLWFEDNGIGIPADMRTRVFGMFQRLSKDYEGTGIGLALVKKVAERMGGAVGVESEPGAGSRFWIEFQAA